MSNQKGERVTIKEGVVIGDNVTIEDDVYLDYNCIIRDNVTIKQGTFIGANSIIGEYTAAWYKDHNTVQEHLIIGEESLIRSGATIYSGSAIGDYFQTGHNVTIRENSNIGNHCSVGTLSDIQGNCDIGNYVRLHSNVHVGMKTTISDYVWVFPYVIFTNDPTPPSEELLGVTVQSFAIIATGSVILPGVNIASDSLIAAGAIVTRDVLEFAVVAGNPAKQISTIDKIKNRFTGENVYPWRYYFKKDMPWETLGYEAWLVKDGDLVLNKPSYGI